MKNRVGITLYNVRNELKEDFFGTLKVLADMGYPAIQLSGFDFKTQDPVKIKSEADKLGLKIAGMHFSYGAVQNELDFYMNYMDIVGSRYMVVPALPEEVRSLDGFKKAADILNEKGRILKENGFKLGYHNHAFEFEKYGDKMGMDILMENLEPDLVFFEADVYWVKKGGQDILKTLNKYNRKAYLLHIKDMEDSEEASFCEIGEGTIDFKEIFQLKDKYEIDWFVIEQDRGNKPALESAKISIDNLKKMGLF